MLKRPAYLTNKQLIPEIAKFKETGIMSEELGEMIVLLTWKIMNKSNFNKYHGAHKAEMIGEALENCMKYLHNFDINHPKANAFGYLSQMIHNSFKNAIKKQGRHSKLKDALYKQRMVLYESICYTIKGIDYQVLKKDDLKK